jgi:drug/metabolite transporter (DMT)-like permease
MTPASPAPPNAADAKSRPWLGVGLIVVAAAAFSAQNVLSRVAYDWGATPMTVTALRTWFALFVFAAVLGRRGLWPRVPRHALGLFAVTAFFYALHNPATLLSFRYIPVGLAILILYLFPILVALILAVLARAPPRRHDVLAALAAFAGVALVLEIGRGALDWRGIGLAVLAAFGLAINVVGAARLGRHMPALVVPFTLSLVGAVVFGGLALAEGGPILPKSGAGWLWLLAAAGVTPVALFSFYAALPLAGAARAALTMNLEPLLTVLLAMALLGEVLGEWQWAGAGLILATLAAHAWLEARRQET